MAKSDVFKNKITKAQEDLFKAIETEKTKKKTLSDKIVQELSKLDKANVRVLNALNKEYVEECNKNGEKLKIFVDTISELNDELQTSIDDYNKYCEEHDELAILKEKNEQEKIVLKSKFKREIQDINIKIDRIEKELKETLETNEESFNEELTTYKSKIIEFDKRKAFEIKKIQDNTIKEYDEYQKLLLTENKKSEIKSINKKIKQIRYNGIIEEKECLLRHLAEKRQFELDFAKREYEFKCGCSTLTKEYNFKVEDTKFDKSLIEFNYKKNEVSNDNNVIHNFNEIEKQKKLNQNAKVEDLHKLINERTLEQLSFEYTKADSEASIAKKIYQGIEENDKKQADKFIESTNKELTLINKDTILFQKNLNLTVTFYIQNIISTYTTYFKNYVSKEEIFVNNLLINDIKGAFLQGNSYEEYVNQVKEIFETFRSKEEEFIESFTSYLTMTLHNFIDQIESFANTIIMLNTNINQVMTNYHKEINDVLAAATLKGFSVVETIQNKTKEEVGAREYDNKALFEERITKSEVEKIAINKEYEEREKEVSNIRQAQEVEFKAEYTELEKVKNAEKQKIQTAINTELNTFSSDYDAKVKAINLKFDEEIKAVDKQYKQKIGLL